MKKKLVAIGIFILAALLTPGACLGQAQLGAGQVWGNSTAARAPGKAENVTAILDRALTSVRGSLLERGASGWVGVAPGASGKPYVSNGAGADPVYQTLGIVGGGTNCTAASGTCLDNITGFAANGVLVRTGSGTYSILTPLTVALGGTNCTSASGTCLDNISGFGSTGFVNRTGAGSYAFATAPAGAVVGTTDAQTLTNKVFNCANNTCTVRLNTSDVTGALPFANLPAGASDTALGYWGSTVVSALAVNNCSNALTYSTSTHSFGCNTLAGTGTVTSVQISPGAGIAVATTSGSNPITSAGNLTVSANNSMGANKYQVFTTGTNVTLNTPTGAAWAKFTLVGGGGQGSGGGTSAGAGSNGNPTCLAASGTACGTTISVAGGGGGGSFSTGAGGTGGIPTGTCTASLGGQAGAPTGNPGSGTVNSGGVGGSTALFGGGGNGAFGNVTGAAGVAGTGGGGQGGGAGSSTSAGAGGGGGAVCVNFVQSPAASYVYTIGPGGSGTNNGSTGSSGGAGAGGRLEVEYGFN